MLQRGWEAFFRGREKKSNEDMINKMIAWVGGGDEGGWRPVATRVNK